MNGVVIFIEHAELSFEEFQTSDYIEEKLKEFGGIEIKRPTKTGVVGIIGGALPGPTIALRCDIDALPMTETNDLPFVSENKGAMHSCGHDGHAAILLGTAKLLWRRRQKRELHGKLICIFQHAEEPSTGRCNRAC